MDILKHLFDDPETDQVVKEILISIAAALAVVLMMRFLRVKT